MQQRRDPQTGQWAFSCQHGAPECEGNLAQSCGIHVIKNEESSEKVQDLTVALIICAMTSKYPPTAVPKVAIYLFLTRLRSDRLDISTDTDNC